MRVLHVIPSLSPSSGGPSVALPAMARALSAKGVRVDVITTDDDGPGRRLTNIQPGAVVDMDGWTIRHFPKQTEFYKVSLPLWRWLRAHVKDYDLVHVHAVFSFASLAAGRVAARTAVPYVVRPLGVLSRWGMANRRKLVKSLSFRLLDLPMLRKAAAMHYTSQMELRDAARFNLPNRQVVLPIGIDLSPFVELAPKKIFEQRHGVVSDTLNILFLSRIDVKKGLDVLLAAFALIHAKHQHTRLIICGGGAADLVASLKQQASSLGVEDRVIWAGEVTAEMRLSALAVADLFVLPSHSENFGIALLEAMAAGLACVSSDQVALAMEARSAVKVVALEMAVLAEAMDALLNSRQEREQLGKTAHRLAFQRYSLEAMGDGLQELYQSIVGHAP